MNKKVILIKREFFGALKGVGHFTEEDELQEQLKF